MKALIFDMDGVLVDVSNSYRLAIKETVKFFTDVSIEDSEIQELKNKGGFNNDWNLTAALIKEKGKKVRKEDVVKKFQQLYLGKNYDGFINNEDWLLKKDVLDELKIKFRLGIVTGRSREEAEYALRKAGTEKYFDFMMTMDDMEEEKPNPLLLQIALEQLECTDGYYVGDCIDDMEMARKASITAIGVLPPNSDKKLKKMLIDNGAKVVLDHINSVKEVVQ